MAKETETKPELDITRLQRTVLTRFGLAIIILGLMIFLPAGTLSYWEGWVMMAIFFIPMAFVGMYLLRNEPDLLDRRMRYKEKEKEQKTIVTLGGILFLLVFLLPGFDKRYNWSEVPRIVVVAADILMLLAYSLFFWVMKVNQYASRIIEVEQDQRVVTTGPYAYVRHPMYFAGSILYLCLPIALGSYWAFLPACLLTFLLVFRIKNEERILIEQLKGYSEYVKSVKHRLIPGLWVPI